mgnify:CR=1 FL=1
MPPGTESFLNGFAMNPPDSLILQTGESTWLRAAHHLVAALALLSLLLANTTAVLKSTAIIIFLLVFAATRRRSRESARRGQLRLSRDGGMQFWNGAAAETRAEREGNAWVSRWVSVVPGRETRSGRIHYWVVCASDNEPDAYRRMLVWMRLGRHKWAPLGKADG